MEFAKGDKVKHPTWGDGRVQEDSDGDTVRVYFKHIGEKLFKLQFANLAKLSEGESSESNLKDKLPRRRLPEEIGLLETFLNEPESLSQADRRYLIFFKEQLLQSLYELSEAIGEAPTIQIPKFTSWLKFISTGTTHSQFSEDRVDRFRVAERKQRQDYLKAQEEYQAIIDAIAKEVERQQDDIARLIDGLRDKVNDQIILKPVKLHWKLLPPGETTLDQIINHFERISRQRPDIVIDIARLTKVYSLRPDLIYIGTDEFEGYLVFYFRKASKAVLECAVSGNAIYVIKENWEELSRLSKFELLHYHGDRVTRIVHKGAWFSHLKTVLNGRPVRKNI
jgi:uncharacterized protein DUF3553